MIIDASDKVGDCRLLSCKLIAQILVIVMPSAHVIIVIKGQSVFWDQMHMSLATIFFNRHPATIGHVMSLYGKFVCVLLDFPYESAQEIAVLIGKLIQDISRQRVFKLHRSTYHMSDFKFRSLGRMHNLHSHHYHLLELL